METLTSKVKDSDTVLKIPQLPAVHNVPHRKGTSRNWIGVIAAVSKFRHTHTNQHVSETTRHGWRLPRVSNARCCKVVNGFTRLRLGVFVCVPLNIISNHTNVPQVKSSDRRGKGGETTRGREGVHDVSMKELR